MIAKTLNPVQLKAALVVRARALGFCGFGIARADAARAAGLRLRAWVSQGMHGTMRWMENRVALRADLTKLWPEARSIIVVADSYTPPVDPLSLLADRRRGVISCYAWGRDYHDVVKGRLKTLAGWLAARAQVDVKVFVDTAPVMEKAFAAAAGLGWQGKHTNLLSRAFGNWVFLGLIATPLELPADEPARDRCGRCTRCLTVCPTGAFPAPYVLDARRCISYLTIEHKGPVDPALRPLLGNRIYGCDDCLAVCPWNKFAQRARDVRHFAATDRIAPDLAELAQLDEATFRARFAASAIKRIGRNRFLRNVLYAIGNSGEPRLAEAARPHLADPDPVVADAAAWALARLSAQ